MEDLKDILRPTWGSEYWISEGWNQLTIVEKNLIKGRMDELFKQGLPFELKNDKLLYIYTFSLLAQLEVLAIQVPLKFQTKMSTPEFQQRMRTQLLDEIFHGMVFTKIVYLLCAPLAFPPAYNANIEVLCDFIRNEDCPKVAMMLLNLIGEGWIEEIFFSLQQQGIAPKVFTTILHDEQRHVSEADLYRDIGMPDLSLIAPKLEYLEELLLTNIFLQYKYMYSISALLGIEGATQFINALDKKHQQQLHKINLKPSKNWSLFMKMNQELMPEIQQFALGNNPVEMTPIRKVFMTQWDNPSDPTMVGQFNLNVSCLDFFNKKYPSETLTTLMLQTISQGLSENQSFRSYLSHKQLYQSKEAYVGLVVKLPDCGDHLGTIVFANCHELTLQQLSCKIRNTLKMMVYCYKKREQLEKTYPHLSDITNDVLYDFANDLYTFPIPGNAMVSLSNIGFCGYSQTKSPLRSNESMKVTLLEIERKLVWQKTTQSFEAQDILPVSISADHRIFDGNLPVPHLVAHYFEKMFAKMLDDLPFATNTEVKNQDTQVSKLIEQLITSNPEMGYKILTMLQTYWLDFLSFDHLMNTHLYKQMADYIA